MRTTLAIVLALLALPAAGQRPILVSFQGLIEDASGNPLDQDSLTVHFALYEQVQGGLDVWKETQTVEISSGLLNAYLGVNSPLSKELFDYQLWLGIAVESDPEMVPRTLPAVAPYAAALHDSTELAGLGTACIDDGGCLSGFCTDGVCCEASCGETCRTCDGSVPGTCEFLPEGWPETACAPYLCSASGSCATNCTSATDCWDEFTFYCDAGSCLSKKAAGENCTFDVECLSGSCIADVCD